jgi:hypothetical protein
MASIACRCSKVKIQFTSASPRVSTECCCDHCFARVQCLEALGGPNVSTNEPLLASKWDDKVTILEGREHLFVYKMNRTTQVTNIAASCCHTFILGKHSVYDANCVTTSSDFPIFSNQENMESSTRWFSNQWGPERLSKCQQLIGIWVKDDGTIAGEEGFEDVLKAHLASTERPISKGAEGESLQEIVASIGTDTIRIMSGV